MSTTVRPAQLLETMAPMARRQFGSDAAWARSAGVPKETLSRLRTQPSCDLRTLAALAASAGFTLAAVPSDAAPGEHLPASLDRAHEARLLDLAASGNVDPAVWRGAGPAFFMGGLAAMLAGARGFERARYLELAEQLHPGISTPEVFSAWLSQSPVELSRFLPMARRRKAGA